MAVRKFIFEKILLLGILLASVWGFWYFEESFTLRILVVALSLTALFFGFSKAPSEREFSSKRELLMLLILYLGLFSLYNFLYSINIPIYLVMMAVLGLVSILFFSLLSLDKIDSLMGKEVFHLFIALMGLVVLEVFLALYFWPINPETKSLIIVVIFYLITSLIYLYVHSMLRLRRIVGFLIVSLLILGIILIFTWLGLAK